MTTTTGIRTTAISTTRTKMNPTRTPTHTATPTPSHWRQRRRRASVGLLVLSTLVAACGDDSAGGDTTRATVTRRVIALDEFAGLAALTVGITPVHVDTVFGYATASDVFDHLGVTTGTAGTDGVDLEAVAALTPTEIIGVSIPTTASAEVNLDELAPTTVIEYTATWQDQLRTVGQALGRVDQAAAVIARVEESIAALKADLAAAGRDGTTVSIVGYRDGLFALSRTGAVGSLLTQLGLDRPAPQDVDTEPTNPFVALAAEQLTDHDADVFIVLSGSAYPTEPLTESPLWNTLEAVQNDSTALVAAEPWFSANAYGVDWIVDDLRAILLDEGDVGTDSDAVDRWTSFAEGT
jgi:iron complex transport system substrate-binding protein